jgi:hypothetical protein
LTGRPYIPYPREGWISPRARSREPWIERQATIQDREKAEGEVEVEERREGEGKRATEAAAPVYY